MSRGPLDSCTSPKPMETEPIRRFRLKKKKKGCLYLPLLEAHEIFSCLVLHAGRQLLWGVSASFYQRMMQSGNKMTQLWHHRLRGIAGGGQRPPFCSTCVKEKVNLEKAN